MISRLAASWEDYRRDAWASARVLVVDDEPAVCMTLSAVLGASKLHVDTASSLGDARALLGARGYDLLVIDKNLPDGSGVVLVEEVSSGADYVPSVVITGFPSASTLVDALTAGASDYLAKPFGQLDELCARLCAVIERRISRRLSDRMVADLTAELSAGGEACAPVTWIVSQLFAFKRDLARRPSVLLVEENPSVAAVVRETLVAGGLGCEVVTHLETARGWLSRPDSPLSALLSVDAAEGLSVVRTFKEIDPRLEVVVTCGGSDPEIALGAVRAGASDYVVRSLESIEVLQTRMQRAVARARRRHLHLHLFGTLYRAAQTTGATFSSGFFEEAGEALEADAGIPIEVEPPQALPVEEIDLSDLFAGEEDLDVQVERGARPSVAVTVRTAGSEDAADRRQRPRVEVSLEVRFQVGGGADIIYGHLKDVSAGGLFLPMTRPLEIGDRLNLEIRPGWNVNAVQVVGEVVRQVRGGPGYGEPSGVGVKLIAGQTELQRVIEGLAREGRARGARGPT